MIEGSPHIPPAIPMLLSAMAESLTWADMRKRTRGILRELKYQSEAYLISTEHQQPIRHTPNQFHIRAHAGLDLFSRSDNCPALNCRIQQAERVSRSLGLLADKFWLTDHFSATLIEFGRASNKKIDMLIEDTIVLSRIAPLIKAGIVGFHPPPVIYCRDCMRKFNSEADSIIEELSASLTKEIKMEVFDEAILIDIGKNYDPHQHLTLFRNEGARPPTKKAVATEIVTREIHSALRAARDASQVNGAVFSNSKIALSGLLQAEGRNHSIGANDVLDASRDIRIPWVSGLTAEQIVELRQEAASALPLFRAKMAKALVARDSSNNGSASTNSLILELREQAAEVNSELQITKNKSARFWKTTYGILGLGLSAYGVATDQPVAGVAGLLPIIQLLIGHQTSHDKDLAKVKSKPGYVLVKAQDILSHADGHNADGLAW
jgi:hypothetical protein